MTADGLIPYPECRHSGLPWLGKIPVHWEVRRNARLFAERNQTGFPDLPILEVSIRTGVTVRDMDNQKRKQMMTDRSKYKRTVKCDIAYNMMRMWQGAVGVAPVDGLVSPAYVVAKPLYEVDSRYYAYLFRTHAYMNEVNKYSRGIVTDRNRLYWDEFRQMPSIFPPVEEQMAVAKYLDYNAAIVARFVRAKRLQIELLQEQKLTAVQRRLARMPSDEIALRSVCDIRLSGVDKHTRAEETPVRLCNYTDVYKHDAITQEMDFMPATATASEISGFSLHKGDVLITKDSEDWRDIAVPAVVQDDLTGVLCGYHLALLRPNSDRIDSHFLFRCLTAPNVNRQFCLAANGVTRYGLSRQAIKVAWIPLPSLEQQRSTVEAIRAEVESTDQLIARLHRQIDLIREFRTRLVADVVMGKLDVRQAQAELPETHLDAVDVNEDVAEDLDEAPDGTEEVTVGDE